MSSCPSDSRPSDRILLEVFASIGFGFPTELRGKSESDGREYLQQKSPGGELAQLLAAAQDDEAAERDTVQLLREMPQELLNAICRLAQIESLSLRSAISAMRDAMVSEWSWV